MDKKNGLAFSGGGFRAAAFHLGTLRKLKELDILKNIDVISTISGGSITGAFYALNNDEFDKFEDKIRNGLKRNMLVTCYFFAIVAGIILLGLPLYLSYLVWYFLFFYILILFIFLKLQFNILPFSKLIERRYNRIFFKNSKLKDLPDKPLLVINSTNIDTGRPFSFSKEKMSDSKYEFPEEGKKSIEFIHDTFPISRAVMASTCVPFAFTPVKIKICFYKDKNDFPLIDPTLVDGGVYDNQGIHKLTQTKSIYNCNTIIVSDAGTGFNPITKMNNTLMLLMQTSNLFMNRIKNIQFINNVILNNYLGKREITYFSLEYEPENCIKYFVKYAKEGKILDEVLHEHNLTSELLKKSKEEVVNYMKNKLNYQKLVQNFPNTDERIIARSVKTNLTSLTDEKIDSLVKIAEILTELQIKLYCPSLLKK